jgi:hypothetical protein
MSARERFERGDIDVDRFETELALELQRPEPTKRKRRRVKPRWVLLLVDGLLLIGMSAVIAVLAAQPQHHPSVSATCRNHDGVSRVDEVIVDGYGHSIICRDGYSRTFSGRVAP